LRHQAFINGQWVNADSGETLKVYNPATGELIGTVAKCGTLETRRAIDAAQKAFLDWHTKPAKVRSNLLRRWFELMMGHQNDFAGILTTEMGKPLAEAKGEIAYGSQLYRMVCGRSKTCVWRHYPCT
jgi:succinate-semialdehyde dehydrogenase/glutarate-semialdehyde dehydrogenase